MLDDFVAGSAAEAGDEAGAAGVVIGVAPVGVVTVNLGRAGSGRVVTATASTARVVHTSLLNERGEEVQRRILIG
jgi:hypothetical protein